MLRFVTRQDEAPDYICTYSLMSILTCRMMHHGGDSEVSTCGQTFTFSQSHTHTPVIFVQANLNESLIEMTPRDVTVPTTASMGENRRSVTI